MTSFDTSRFRRVVDAAKAANASHLRQLPLALIDPDPDQPRKSFEDLDDFAESIKAHGVVQPITVTPQGGRFRLVYGERRYRASIKAGLATIPALVEPGGAPNRRERQLVENLHRADLTPTEIGHAVKELLAETSTAAVAQVLGKPKSWVSQHAAISEMPVVLARLLANGSPLRAVYDLHVAAKKDPAILTAAEALDHVTVAAAWRLAHGAEAAGLDRSGEAAPSLPVRVDAIQPTETHRLGVGRSRQPMAVVEAVPASSSVQDARVAMLESQMTEALGSQVRIVVSDNEPSSVLIEVASLSEVEEMVRCLCRR